MKKKLMIATNCIITAGAVNFCLVDLQKQDIYLLSQEEYLLICKSKFDLLEELNPTLVEKLLFREIIIPFDKGMDKLSMQFHSYSKISNAVVEIAEINLKKIEKIICQLSELSCISIELYFKDSITRNKLAELLRIFNDKLIESIFIFIKQDKFLTTKYLQMLKAEFPRLARVYIHSCDNVTVSDDFFIFLKSDISNSITCGIVHPYYFAVNISHFTESQHHNTCLNRKISIDVNGEIKNCPSMDKSYGNIRDTKLIDVVNNPEFQKVWHIKKDEITKCKDCEFRHICTDCRAYIENPDDQYSAPLKCGYNPYTCEWEEWSTNPLKQKAIEFYGMQDLVKK